VSIFFILGILTQIRDAAKKLEDFNQKLRQGAPPPFPQSSNRISPPVPLGPSVAARASLMGWAEYYC